MSILTHEQFQKKLSALEELFEINLERVQKAIYEAKRNGHEPSAIVLPPIEFLGLPVKISNQVSKVTIEAHGYKRTNSVMESSEKSG